MVAPLLAPLLASGCLIPEAPEYGPPQKTPIFIIDSSVSPSPRSLVTRKSTDTMPIEFSFEVRSEDAGDRLVAALYADYKHKGSTWLDYRYYEPRTFDEPRQIRFYMSVDDGRLDPERTCHSVTLLVLHELSGWDPDKKQPIGAPGDLASVTWFLGIGDEVEPSKLSDCPDPADVIEEPTDEPG